MKAWKLLRQLVLRRFRNLLDAMKISGILFGLIVILWRGYAVYYGISFDQVLPVGPEQGQFMHGWPWPSAAFLSIITIL